MITGDTDILVRYLEQADGTALNYATKALFVAAGFNLIWKDNTGTALATQPDWELQASSGSRHQFSYVIPDGAWTVDTIVPSTYVCTPKESTGEGQPYDSRSIGSLLAATATVSISPTATATQADMFDGDSIFIQGITIPEAALTAIGAISLADCTTRLAFIKRNSQDSNDAPDVAAVDGLTVTATSDTSGSRIVKAECTTFPVILGVLDDQDQLGATLQVRLTKGTKEIVAAEVALTVKWVSTQGEAVP